MNKPVIVKDEPRKLGNEAFAAAALSAVDNPSCLPDLNNQLYVCFKIPFLIFFQSASMSMYGQNGYQPQGFFGGFGPTAYSTPAPPYNYQMTNFKL